MASITSEPVPIAHALLDCVACHQSMVARIVGERQHPGPLTRDVAELVEVATRVGRERAERRQQ